jgi:Spy/CpxP family protein refolding chaperone
MKALTKATVVALAVLSAGATMAAYAGGGEQASHMQNLALLLDLTDAQKPQVQAILQGEHQQMKALMEQSRAADGKPDFEALRAAHQQISQDTLTKLSGVLSPVQLQKFQALQQMHHGFGHHPGANGPPPAPTTSN